MRVGEFAFDNSCSYTAIAKCDPQKCSLPNLYKTCKAHISKITELMFQIPAI